MEEHITPQDKLHVQPAEPEPAPLDPHKCASCGSSMPEPGHAVPLCKDCRDKMSKFPIPPYVIAMLLITLILVLAAFYKFPDTLQAGVSFEKGINAEKAGKYDDAVSEYLKAYKQHKDSTDLQARLAITLFKEKNYNESAVIFNMLAGKELSETLAAEVNGTIKELDKIFEEQDKAAKPEKKGKKGKKARKE